MESYIRIEIRNADLGNFLLPKSAFLFIILKGCFCFIFSWITCGIMIY